MTAKLGISDGTTRISLLNGEDGFWLNSWRPAIAQYKGGGVKQSSSMADGSQLVDKKWGNVVESLDLKTYAASQDLAYRNGQEIRRLLEKASDYWTGWQNQPVWIEAQASKETNMRYAIIHQGTVPEDDNPFAQPFLQPYCGAGMDGMGLVVERGHWGESIPGTENCVEISGVQYNWQGNDFLNPGFETAGATPPVFANWTESVGDGFIAIGHPGFMGDDYCYAHRGATDNTYIYQDVNASAEYEYELAFYTYIHEHYGACPGSYPGRYRIYDVTNGADIVGVKPIPTDTTRAWIQILETFIAPAGCNTIRLYLYPPEGDCAGTYVGTRYDEVHIKGGAPQGREETCEKEVYIVNKKNIAQLTHIYYWDDVPGAWSGNLLGAAGPTALLPAVPTVDDFIIFGIDTSVADSGLFNNLVFDISTIQNDLEIAWRYSDAAGDPIGWTEFLPAAIQDNTNHDGAEDQEPFDTEGVKSIHFAQLVGWTAENPNPGIALGTTAYWVCAHVTAVGGAESPPWQGNRDIYTATWPYIEIGSDIVEGDIPALARHLLENQSGDTWFGNRFIYGLRSVSRGENFTAFINLSDEQNPTGITVLDPAVDPGAETTFHDNADAPTGRSIYFEPGGVIALTHQATVELDETVSKEYIGNYHCYLRCDQTGVTYDMSAEVRAIIGNVEVDRTNEGKLLNYSDYGIIDLGELTIPELFYNFTLEFHIYLAHAGAGATIKLDVFDLILIPVDECSMSCERPEEGADGVQHYYDLDLSSLTPKSTAYAYEILESDNLSAPYQISMVGPHILQSNKKQRMWYFVMKIADDSVPALEGTITASTAISHKVQLSKWQRYLSGRGDR